MQREQGNHTAAVAQGCCSKHCSQPPGKLAGDARGLQQALAGSSSTRVRNYLLAPAKGLPGERSRQSSQVNYT